VPAVLLESWPLETPMWDGDELAGPVPTLFSEVERAVEFALASPGRLHADMAKFARLFGVVEHVEPDETARILKKPRWSMADESKYSYTKFQKISVYDFWRITKIKFLVHAGRQWWSSPSREASGSRQSPC